MPVLADMRPHQEAFFAISDGGLQQVPQAHVPYRVSALSSAATVHGVVIDW